MTDRPSPGWLEHTEVGPHGIELAGDEGNAIGDDMRDGVRVPRQPDPTVEAEFAPDSPDVLKRLRGGPSDPSSDTYWESRRELAKERRDDALDQRQHEREMDR